MKKAEPFLPQKGIEVQPFIPGLFEKTPLRRTDELTQIFKIPVSILDHEQFGFNQIALPSELSFAVLASNNDDVQVNLEVAYEELLFVAASAIRMPLCLWAMDAVFDHQTKDGGRLSLPPRPNPKHKLIILTQGKFSNISGSEHNRHVLLKEGPNGEFEVFTAKRFETIIMYPAPGWDLVTLCVPRLACTSTEPVGPETP